MGAISEHNFKRLGISCMTVNVRFHCNTQPSQQVMSVFGQIFFVVDINSSCRKYEVPVNKFMLSQQPLLALSHAEMDDTICGKASCKSHG